MYASETANRHISERGRVVSERDRQFDSHLVTAAGLELSEVAHETELRASVGGELHITSGARLELIVIQQRRAEFQ